MSAPQAKQGARRLQRAPLHQLPLLGRAVVCASRPRRVGPRAARASIAARRPCPSAGTAGAPRLAWLQARGARPANEVRLQASSRRRGVSKVRRAPGLPRATLQARLFYAVLEVDVGAGQQRAQLGHRQGVQAVGGRHPQAAHALQAAKRAPKRGLGERKVQPAHSTTPLGAQACCSRLAIQHAGAAGPLDGLQIWGGGGGGI